MLAGVFFWKNHEYCLTFDFLFGNEAKGSGIKRIVPVITQHKIIIMLEGVIFY